MSSFLIVGCGRDKNQLEEIPLEANTQSETKETSLPQNQNKENPTIEGGNQNSQNKTRLEDIKNRINNIDKLIDESENLDADIESEKDINEINNIEEEFAEE